MGHGQDTAVFRTRPSTINATGGLQQQKREFQTLDLFGPLEFLGWLPDEVSFTVVAENSGIVPSGSGQGIRVVRR